MTYFVIRATPINRINGMGHKLELKSSKKIRIIKNFKSTSRKQLDKLFLSQKFLSQACVWFPEITFIQICMHVCGGCTISQNRPDQTKFTHYFKEQIGHEILLNAFVKYTCMHVTCQPCYFSVAVLYHVCSTLLSNEEVERSG